MGRGDRREDTYLNKAAPQDFLKTLAPAMPADGLAGSCLLPEERDHLAGEVYPPEEIRLGVAQN
jgi:hypothetical protein